MSAPPALSPACVCQHRPSRPEQECCDSKEEDGYWSEVGSRRNRDHGETEVEEQPSKSTCDYGADEGESPSNVPGDEECEELRDDLHEATSIDGTEKRRGCETDDEARPGAEGYT